MPEPVSSPPYSPRVKLVTVKVWFAPKSSVPPFMVSAELLTKASLASSAMVPATRLVAPLYVLAACKVSTPLPSLVRFLPVPDMTPLTVKAFSPPIDASAANTVAPLATPLPTLSVNAPTPALTPLPDKLRLLATVFP